MLLISVSAQWRLSLTRATEKAAKRMKCDSIAAEAMEQMELSLLFSSAHFPLRLLRTDKSLLSSSAYPLLLCLLCSAVLELVHVPVPARTGKNWSYHPVYNGFSNPMANWPMPILSDKQYVFDRFYHRDYLLYSLNCIRQKKRAPSTCVKNF